MLPAQTSHKAWAGAAATAIAYLAAVLGYGEAPPVDDVIAVVTLVAETLVSAAVGFAAVWLKRNYKK